MNHLQKIKIEKTAGYIRLQRSLIPTLKNHQYFVESGRSITGDAPKEFIRVYEYGAARKDSPGKWPLYIAKTGHKWYPNESIMEHLLNRIGTCLGVNMSYSRLVWAGGQLRFLSRYFLREDEELIHGADVYAGYMNDKFFVEQIETENRARDFFTVHFTHQALSTAFPEQADGIFEELMKMLVFDAFIGNNDRHFYNWGIIRDLTGRRQPCFSPIYDSARGLFWNESEEKIVHLSRQVRQKEQYLRKYIQGSRPKIGWEGQPNINHFKLVELFFTYEYGITKDTIRNLLSVDILKVCLRMIDTEFTGLLSPERLALIKNCLNMRHKHLSDLIS